MNLPVGTWFSVKTGQDQPCKILADLRTLWERAEVWFRVRGLSMIFIRSNLEKRFYPPLICAILLSFANPTASENGPVVSCPEKDSLLLEGNERPQMIYQCLNYNESSVIWLLLKRWALEISAAPIISFRLHLNRYTKSVSWQKANQTSAGCCLCVYPRQLVPPLGPFKCREFFMICKEKSWKRLSWADPVRRVWLTRILAIFDTKALCFCYANFIKLHCTWTSAWQGTAQRVSVQTHLHHKEENINAI